MKDGVTRSLFALVCAEIVTVEEEKWVEANGKMRTHALCVLKSSVPKESDMDVGTAFLQV